MNGWKIELSKLPNYDNFKGEFVEKLDWKILNLIYESQFWIQDQKSKRK